MSPEQAQGQPAGPASDVFSLGTVLVMACTGTCPFNGPSVPGTLYNIVYAEPDLGALPAKVRPLVARCLAKDPAARPSPARLLDDIGRLARKDRPWPTEVHELIAAQQAEIARLQEELELRTRELAELSRAGDDGDDGAAVVIEAPPTAPEPGSGRARPRFAVLAGTALAGTALTAATVIALDPGGGADTRTIERPPRATATVERTPERTPEQPSPEPTTEAPPVEEATTPDTEPSAVSEPSRRAPTRIETRPSTRPAAIADCEGKAQTRPDYLLLACGDGEAGLLNLVWSGWGTPVARATGLGWHVVCEPDCATGREVRYQVTVTATGPTAGRYTLMRINAPGTPDPVRLYTLDENGPTASD